MSRISVSPFGTCSWGSVCLRKRLLAFLGLGLLVTLLPSAKGALIAADTYETYDAGPLGGGDGGFGWSGPWDEGAAVDEVTDTTSAMLSYAPVGGELMAGGARAVQVTPASSGVHSLRGLVSPLTDTFYVRYLVRRVGGGMSGNCTFSLYGSDANGAAISGLTNSLNVGFRRDPTQSITSFMVRQATGLPLAGATIQLSPVLNQTYCVVARFVFTNSAFRQIDAWINPGHSDHAAPVVSAAYAQGLDSVSTVFFRSAGLSCGFDVDDLVLGWTWSDVMPTGPPPELGVTRLPAGLQLDWNAPNWLLEQTTLLSSPIWEEIPGARPPFGASTTDRQLYFRLRQPRVIVPTEPLVLWAATNFPDLAAGAVPAYRDHTHNALAINTAGLPPADLGKFAAATTAFEAPGGSYDIALTSLTERDGECTFRLLIDGVLVGQFTNPRVYPSTTEYTEHSAIFSNIAVAANANLRVEFNSHSNELVPEPGGFASARGRWRKVVFSPSVSGSTGTGIVSGLGMVMEAVGTHVAGGF